MHRPARNNQHGFSLIEMGISLVIISLLMVGGLYLYKSYKRDRNVVNEQAARERVISALDEFVQKYDRFPCPAPANLVPDSADFGKEPAGCSAGVAGPDAILTGMVPVYTLNLPFQRSLDIYSRKMTYAVTQALTKANGVNNPAAAIRITANNGEVRDAQFVLVNHGPDGKGAVALMAATPGLPCNGPADDVENCDEDRDFNDFLYAAQGTPYSPGHFDDRLSYTLASKETSLWMMAPSASGLRITNKNNANVGIGRTVPSEKLHVSGGVMIDSGSNEVEVTASGKITTSATTTPGSGEIHSEKQIEAGTTMQGDKIRAHIFTYTPDAP